MNTPHATPLCPLDEEHELPTLEAVLAGTLALMTGYAQALQADLHPEQRLAMGAKIGRNLELLAAHVTVSEPFRHIALGLQARWQSMSRCTAQSAPCGAAHGAAAAPPTLH
ncbi:hypothetical protein [Piscinibacter sp.]|uniref:hypothetical protein n=1 Tax=Piscinibacter sp. TaxID=1903157 RepID=UPI0039E29840